MGAKIRWAIRGISALAEQGYCSLWLRVLDGRTTEKTAALGEFPNPAVRFQAV